MVVSDAKGHGRFFALRLGVMIALILTFGLLSQLVALATIFGYAGPAYALAALVVVNASAQIVTGIRHRRRVAEKGSVLWVFRSATQELILVGGLVAIGMGHNDAGWWAAITYLIWTGCETAVKYRRTEVAPRRDARRSLERRFAEAEAKVQQADTSIELAESIMVGSPDDEDIQSAAQQLRQAAMVARQEALEGLRDTRSTEVQIRAYNRARLRAALDDVENSRRPADSEPHPAHPTDPWDGMISDRWPT